MKTSLVLFLFILFPIITLAQNGLVTGKVLHADTKSPLTGASVFLSNSSFGATTTTDGTFTLSDIPPGQYTLVVTIIGYESYSQKVAVNAEDIKLNIELTPKTVRLQEVNISSPTKAELKMYYEQFKEEFIGIDKNAEACKIINPDILNLKFNKAKNVLNAYTDEFLIVENQALGYRIKFLIKDFTRDGKAGIASYIGEPLFEELPGKEAQLKKWRKNREEAYYGSPMHFYRSLYKNTLAAEGFELHKLTMQLRPKANEQPVAQLKDRRVIKEISLASIYYNEHLSNQLQARDILRSTDQPGLFGITFPDYLYVVYINKKETTYFKDVYRPAGVPNYETTIISLSNRPPHALFDKNGVIVTEGMLYEGAWSKARLSELLPVDYTPGNNVTYN